MKLSGKKSETKAKDEPIVEKIQKKDIEKAHLFSVEEHVLGHLMYEAKRQNSENIFDVFDLLPPEAFESPQNRAMFIEMKQVFAVKGRLDTVVLVSELTKAKKLEQAGGGARILELSAKHNQTTNIQTLSKELYEEYRRKELISKLDAQTNRLREKDYASVDSVIGEIDTEIYALSERKTQTIVNIAKTTEMLIERANSVQRYGLIGFSWGIGRLDVVTGGIELKKSYVVGAVKKAGKTKFLISTIRSLIKQGVLCHFQSMEMESEAVTAELLSSQTGESNNKLKGNLEKDVEDKFRDAVPDIEKYLTVDTQGFLSPFQIRQKMRAASQRGCKVFMIDYIQRMNFEYGLKGNYGRNDASVIASTIARIADYGREYGMAVIMLSQLANRAENVSPKVSDLKDSGGIGEAVDCIILIDNEDRRKGNFGQKTNNVNLLIEQRNGASGCIETVVDLSISRYLDKADPTPEEKRWVGNAQEKN